LSGGIHPHYYCLPILKRRDDQEALLTAALSGNPKFFLGTDSAPHSRHNKESAHGCAGIYTAHAAIELYADIFEQHQALDKLENFASVYGAQFYRRPINTTKIQLQQSSWQVPKQLSFGDTELIPLLAGEEIHWRVTHLTYPDALDT
jgi:dihydroorotase